MAEKVKNELREKQTALRKSVKDAIKEVFSENLLELEENGAVFAHFVEADVEFKIVLKKERIEV